MATNKGSIVYVASVYDHLRGFHVPYMKLLQGWGYDVFGVASRDDCPGARDELETLGFHCVDIPFARNPFDKANALAYRNLSTFLLARDDIKLIHVHTPTAAFITRKVAASVGSKSVVLYTAHGFHFYRGASAWNWLLYYSAEKHAARLTDGIITINSEDYEVAAKRFRLRPNGKVYYVPGVGIDLTVYYPGCKEERQQIRAELAVNPEDIVFVYVAELNHNKNQQQFLRAFRDALCAGNQPIRAWIVGDGPTRSKMESLSRKLDIDSKVSFLGFREDIPTMLRGADVAVLLSYREGLPRCLMEACATGLPVIATDIRGNRDIVDNGVSGILVNPDDVKATARAMKDMAENAHLRKSMGHEGRQRVSMFGLEEIMPEMQSIYYEWLERY